MSIDHSDAIVLKYVEFSESSLILTLFTRDFGKIHGLAKGGRRLKNPFESALDLLTQIRVSFIRKNSDALDLLTESKLINRFRPQRRNFGGMYASFYLIELIDQMTADGEPVPILYDRAVQALSQFQKGIGIERELLAFEWDLLEISGLRPSTRICVECGRPMDLLELEREKQRPFFAMNDGGLLCARCREEGIVREAVPVSAPVLRLLESLGRSESAVSMESPEDPGEFSKSTWGEARGLMNMYICHLLGRKPLMYDYLRNMVSAKE
ncbi:MAG: DNA repair protein RecO [Planctomycetia bacterium]|nr:DNA repair protein RecO [Planctomycetia bacterium]